MKGNNCKLENKNDANDFFSLVSALDILGFNKSEQDTIFRILAAVLHMGNIYFNRTQVN